MSAATVLALLMLADLSPPDPSSSEAFRSDPCRAPASAPSSRRSDPGAAALYREVGDQERAAGNLAAAKVAYRQALGRDPRDERARRSLARLCAMPEAVREAADAPRTDEARPPAGAHFARAVARMDRGDRDGAIAELEAARAEEPDAAAALLEGICEYERGREERARPLFEEARADQQLAGTAAFFLGLIALHADEDERASSLFELAAASDERLATTASALARSARREGRLVVSALVEAGYDSNVPLAPDGTGSAAGNGDGYAAAVAGLFLRPWGWSGPYARAVGTYRKEVVIDRYDLGELSGAVGYRAIRGAQQLAGEYAYERVTLGGSSYLSAHRLLASGRVAPGRVAVALTYSARWESFLADADAAYSGFRQDADLLGEWRAWSSGAVAIGYHLARDAARDDALGFLEHGPAIFGRSGWGADNRIAGEARATFRTYDVADPDLGVRRADRYLDGIVTGERDVADHWTVRLTLTARRALSNVPDFQYTKLTAALGVSYTGALW